MLAPLQFPPLFHSFLSTSIETVFHVLLEFRELFNVPTNPLTNYLLTPPPAILGEGHSLLQGISHIVQLGEAS